MKTWAKAKGIAVPSNDADFARRNFLLLLSAGASWFLTTRLALSQTVIDPNGNPIRLPGQALTPDIQYRERQSIERAQERTLQDRANARAAGQEQQFQNDRAAARKRSSTESRAATPGYS